MGGQGYDILRRLLGQLNYGTAGLTCEEPNELLEPRHNRMPVILSPEAERMWLDRSIESPQVLGELLTPFPAGAMEVYEVSPLVNKVSNDEAACVLSVADAS